MAVLGLGMSRHGTTTLGAIKRLHYHLSSKIVNGQIDDVTAQQLVSFTREG
jgi:hypothetical protein